MAAPSGGVHFSTTEDVPGTSLEAKAGSLGSQHGVDMTPRLFSSKSAKMIGGVELGGPPPPPPLMHRGSSRFSAATQELSGSDTDDAEDDGQQNGGAATRGPSRRTARGASSAAGRRGAPARLLPMLALSIGLAVMLRIVLKFWWVAAPPPPPPPPPSLAIQMASRPLASALLAGALAALAIRVLKLGGWGSDPDIIDGHIVMELRTGKRFRA